MSKPQPQRSNSTLCLCVVITTLFILHQTTTMVVLVAAQEQHQDSTSTNQAWSSQQRLQAKPWFNRSIELGGINLYISPITVLVCWVSLYVLVKQWSASQGPPVYCVASHILLKGHDEATQQRLQKMQQRIGNSPSQFAKHAKEYSTCPSKAQGGALGRFGPGTMAPPFDNVCFDPKTPQNEAVGPIETQFGWHLLYIHERQLPPTTNVKKK